MNISKRFLMWLMFCHQLPTGIWEYLMAENWIDKTGKKFNVKEKEVSIENKTKRKIGKRIRR